MKLIDPFPSLWKREPTLSDTGDTNDAGAAQHCKPSVQSRLHISAPQQRKPVNRKEMVIQPAASNLSQWEHTDYLPSLPDTISIFPTSNPERKRTKMLVQGHE